MNFFYEKACGIKNYSYLCISIEDERLILVNNEQLI